jgi:hypothetical protein
MNEVKKNIYTDVRNFPEDDCIWYFEEGRFEFEFEPEKNQIITDGRFPIESHSCLDVGITTVDELRKCLLDWQERNPDIESDKQYVRQYFDNSLCVIGYGVLVDKEGK